MTKDYYKVTKKKWNEWQWTNPKTGTKMAKPPRRTGPLGGFSKAVIAKYRRTVRKEGFGLTLMRRSYGERLSDQAAGALGARTWENAWFYYGGRGYPAEIACADRDDPNFRLLVRATKQYNSSEAEQFFYANDWRPFVRNTVKVGMIVGIYRKVTGQFDASSKAWVEQARAPKSAAETGTAMSADPE